MLKNYECLQLVLREVLSFVDTKTDDVWLTQAWKKTPLNANNVDTDGEYKVITALHLFNFSARVLSKYKSI